MSDRLVFGDADTPDDDDYVGPAAEPDEEGDDWEARPRSEIAKLPVPPPDYSLIPSDPQEALDLEEELQLEADMKVERRAIGRGKPSQRALAAVRMDGFGFPIAQIARRLRFANVKDAFEIITTTIAALLPQMDLRTARERHSGRLEMLWSGVAARAMDKNSSEQIAYSRQGREILADIARLHGLNAPTQLQVSTPESDEFDKAIMTIFEHRNPDRPKEIDVFDLDEEEPDAEADS